MFPRDPIEKSAEFEEFCKWGHNINARESLYEDYFATMCRKHYEALSTIANLRDQYRQALNREDYAAATDLRLQANAVWIAIRTSLMQA